MVTFINNLINILMYSIILRYNFHYSYCWKSISFSYYLIKTYYVYFGGI